MTWKISFYSTNKDDSILTLDAIVTASNKKDATKIGNDFLEVINAGPFSNFEMKRIVRL